MSEYIIEMLNITKEFPGIKANDDVTLQVKKGEIHALLGENGAGKSTLMSILFGLYQPDSGTIRVRGKEVQITGPRVANDLGIGMTHQHFKLVHNFTVLQSIILGVETVKNGFLQMDEAREKIIALSEKYGLKVDPDATIDEITVGMQQRVEILKMLYRDNDILILDEPTAVLTPQEIDDLMDIMKSLVAEGKSIIFITHKLNEIKEVADRCSVLRRGKLMGVIDVDTTDKEAMSELMVGRKVNFNVSKEDNVLGDEVLRVENLIVKNPQPGHNKPLVNNASFNVRRGEIACIAGVDGNGQSPLVYALTGMMKHDSGKIILGGEDVSKKSIRYRTIHGMGHIPEDRHRYGLILDYNLEENLVMQTYFTPRFQKHGFLKKADISQYAEDLIKKFDIRSGQGGKTSARSMSGGNQQKAIVAREIDRGIDLLIAVQPTRGLDVGAIESIYKYLVAQRDEGKAVLIISLDLDEVFHLADRILVIYEGEIVGDLDPDKTSAKELGLYMAGSKRGEVII